MRDNKIMNLSFANERERMIVEQIERRGIYSSRLLAVMRSVPRHLFVDPLDWQEAYEDHPLPIDMGQTISQPYIVALMTDLLGLQGNEQVLEIGTGSGYQAAVLAGMTNRVHTIEIHPPLAAKAARVLQEAGFMNVSVHIGDGSQGWPVDAPYAGILVAAAAPLVPQPLLVQLCEGGRLVIPVGNRGTQELQRWVKQNDRLICEKILPVAFVPLRGTYGWQEHEWSD